MGFLAGKRALVTGIASNRSIAYGIAKAMHREGAELAFTYQNEKLKPRVEKFAAEFGSDIVIPCDVSTDANIESTFTALSLTGITLIFWCMLLRSHQKSSWPVVLLKIPRVKVRQLLMMSVPTAFWQWPSTPNQ